MRYLSFFLSSSLTPTGRWCTRARTHNPHIHPEERFMHNKCAVCRLKGVSRRASIWQVYSERNKNTPESSQMAKIYNSGTEIRQVIRQRLTQIPLTVWIIRADYCFRCFFSFLSARFVIVVLRVCHSPGVNCCWAENTAWIKLKILICFYWDMNCDYFDRYLNLFLHLLPLARARTLTQALRSAPYIYVKQIGFFLL